MATLLTRNEDDILLVYFQEAGIIDEAQIQNLGQDLINLLNTAAQEKILVNLENVTLMSSAMIGKLIFFQKKCKTANVDLRICSINPNIKEVFDLMQLDKVFKVDEDEAQAITAFNKKSWFN
ncbi:MAG: STAS domain-containing protein [Planctomycetota bacterium]